MRERPRHIVMPYEYVNKLRLITHKFEKKNKRDRGYINQKSQSPTWQVIFSLATSKIRNICSGQWQLNSKKKDFSKKKMFRYTTIEFKFRNAQCDKWDMPGHGAISLLPYLCQKKKIVDIKFRVRRCQNLSHSCPQCVFGRSLPHPQGITDSPSRPIKWNVAWQQHLGFIRWKQATSLELGPLFWHCFNFITTHHVGSL